MDRLILFRHGKAEGASASGRDFDRRLTPRGVRESADTARRLAALGLGPVLALVSPAARARQTWVAAEPLLPAAQVLAARGLYNAEAADIGAIIAEAAADWTGAVIVVAHNPGLHDLALALLAESPAPPQALARLTPGLPTAAAAVFRLDAAGRLAFEDVLLRGAS